MVGDEQRVGPRRPGQVGQLVVEVLDACASHPERIGEPRVLLLEGRDPLVGAATRHPARVSGCLGHRLAPLSLACTVDGKPPTPSPRPYSPDQSGPVSYTHLTLPTIYSV